MEQAIQFELNGKPVSVKADPQRELLWVLRADLGLTGTKFGCGIGACGACTVLVDEKPVRSCQVSVGAISGKRVLTIEGLAAAGELHPVQQVFLDKDAMQCGFCTPGMIMSACGLLAEKRRPTRDEIIDAMEDNLCRCGSYNRIVEAIQAAAKQMKQKRLP